jgi:hypothetical protein
MATSKPGAQFADYLELLKVLSQSNAEALVVGGMGAAVFSLCALRFKQRIA